MQPLKIHQTIWIGFGVTYLCVVMIVAPVRAAPALAPPPDLLAGCWVAFAPTHFAPPTFYPNAIEMGRDLNVLRDAGFTGIVTYGAEKTLGTEIPELATEKGLQLIMGIYNPDRTQAIGQEEYANAVAAKDNVVGYVVGNEGLDVRYDRATLIDTMDDLRIATGKPVTTTEQWHDYANDTSLLTLGDWVFPNTHPYYDNPPITDPVQAGQWTEDRYDQLDQLTTQTVVFKEVGLPSAGEAGLSQANAAEYYRQLRWETHVKFVYFEAFDQPWKRFIDIVEPYWGMFTTNRTPKMVRQYVCGGVPKLVTPLNGGTTINSRPTFRWDSTRAAHYEMQLYTNNPPMQSVVDSPALSYIPPCSLLNRTYYWRVRGVDAAGNLLDWSPINSLTILSPPSVSPAHHYYRTATPILRWDQVSWATEYQVQVGCNLNDPVQNTYVAANTLFLMTSTLPNGSYKWRVRAKHSNGQWGNWSLVQSFMVDVP